MTDPAENKSDHNLPDFSLVEGGLFYRFMRMTHLSNNALMQMRQRIIVLSLIAWLPLLLLTAFEGHLLSGSVAVPFLLDFEAHIRFLLAMPLLIFAELVVHRRMNRLIQQFLKRKLIPEDAVPRFQAAIASASRLRNSSLAEVLLVIFVYGIGILIIWRHYVAIDVATWYAIPMADGSKLSFAGMWYVFVSLPLVQFLLCRWYFRLFIWTRFIWQVSRIPLSLIPTHPDRVGGLGFLVTTVDVLIVLAIAHGALLAGTIANQIFFMGSTLPMFKEEIIVMVIFVQCLIIGPLLMFSPQLTEVKWKGIIDYGALYARGVRELDKRWLHGGASEKNPMAGIKEIQTITDLDGGYRVVQSMHFAPFTWRAMLYLALATLSPIVPLLLTMMPFEELLNMFFSLFLIGNIFHCAFIADDRSILIANGNCIFTRVNQRIVGFLPK